MSKIPWTFERNALNVLRFFYNAIPAAGTDDGPPPLDRSREKYRGCMGCQVPFVSLSPGHRICPKCSERNRKTYTLPASRASCGNAVIDRLSAESEC